VAIATSQTTNFKVEMTKDLSEAINYLKEHLLKYEPEKLFHNIKSVKDIYEYRRTLKEIKSSSKAVALIADMILTAIQKKLRFRTLDCLKVLRNLIKQLPENHELTEETLTQLFEIYKHFIFSDRKEIHWCVSSIIKDKKLGEEAVDWLVSNQPRSKQHIVNRLLLYPVPHPKIKSWAEQVLSKNGLPDRRSELISLLIEQDLPKVAAKEDSSTLQWAIFKSRIPYESKINLLKQYSDFDSIQSTIDIAHRLESPELLRSLLEKLEGVNVS
jgi:hypothetical protein